MSGNSTTQPSRPFLSIVSKWQWLPITVVAFCSACTIWAWLAMLRVEDESIHQTTIRAGSDASNEIQSRMESRNFALARMASRWKAQGDSPLDLWEQDAMSIIRDYAGFQAIGWTSPNFRVERIVPLKGNEQALGLDHTKLPSRKAALDLAKELGGIALTPPINLVQGGKGFLVDVPFNVKEEFGGYIVGVYRANSLFRQILSKDIAPGYQITVHDETVELFRRMDQEIQPRWLHKMSITIANRHWIVQIAPLKSTIQKLQSQMPARLAISGFTLSVLFGLTLFLAQAARRRASELNLANDLLSQHVREQQYAEQLLSSLNTQLRQKNREMEQFVYSASHDLKSPLVTILGYLSYVVKDVESNRHDRLVEFCNSIQRAASDMRKNIDDLLELSRVGRAIDKNSTVNLSDLFNSLVQQFEVQITNANATVQVDKDWLTIPGDELRLRQLFQNLLGNALKYGKSADGTTGIEIGSNSDDNEICIFIRDHGAGVAPEYRERIFDLFHQLDSSHDGTGVGLAIVKRASEVHKGRTWLEETPGGGCTFKTSLPLNVVSPNESNTRN